ncbi:hypothetical protein [Robertkochia solimangrovi]|uniref:hypothetical protein n=1 Tax=Robertkochia solimangrovi TaxID=2213046 RepID=UPI0011805983|nr:hypothetical protein [Robertkochia solimangrovi]TRZ43125.1 hypothetical protein DMZ48_10550 [Robertkochia solimangrovi]
MKRIITILTLIFISTIGFAQTDSIRGNQFELKGKIINEISLTPHCGTIAWGTVIEFEIIEFSDSNYKLDSIGVIFTCPEFYEDGFFEVGKTYTITVADENQADFGWTIPNESILTKYKLDKKLWVIKTDKKE